MYGVYWHEDRQRLPLSVYVRLRPGKPRHTCQADCYCERRKELA
jgi:hypothetical protein